MYDLNHSYRDAYVKRRQAERSMKYMPLHPYHTPTRINARMILAAIGFAVVFWGVVGGLMAMGAK